MYKEQNYAIAKFEQCNGMQIHAERGIWGKCPNCMDLASVDLTQISRKYSAS